MIWFFTAAILATQGFTLFAVSIIGRTLMGQQQVIDQIVVVLGRAREELLGKIADLQAQVESAGLAEQVDLSALTEVADSLDAIVPDAVAEPNPGE